jgi:hypothetical protein
MPDQGETRRERFRRYMSQLSSGVAPLEAIQQALYVPVPGGTVADRLPRRLELEPHSSHLVVGGIGTGKTTQLLKAKETLDATLDVTTLYIDVSRYHDLNRLTPGVLVIVAGLELLRLLPPDPRTPEIASVSKEIRNRAHGYVEWQEGSGTRVVDWLGKLSRYPITHPGLLVRPEPVLARDVAQYVEHVKFIAHEAMALRNTEHIAFFFDSLDRVTDIKAFSDIVLHDIRGIQDAGLGTVLVGPLALLFSVNRPIADRFTHSYQVSPVDDDTATGRQCLVDILRRRAPPGTISEDSIETAARLSGGIIRDLLTLARSAGEDAYVSGADSVTVEHVHTAADTLGRSLLLGLSSDQLRLLTRINQTGRFVQTSDNDIVLLATRRVLDYGNQKFKVHPTIAPLLGEVVLE